MNEWFDALWKVYTANRDDIVPLATFFVRLATFFGAAFVAWAAWRQAKAAWRQAETASRRHCEQTKADSERRITESFAKAIDQLGNAKLEVRLGGIYTLERIACERREYWPIMETLTAYVRERAPWHGPGEDAGRERPATDIAAVLTVLGRRSEEQRKWDQDRWLDLRETDLRGGDLQRANLQEAIFVEANLQGAIIANANLQRAVLVNANLQGAFCQNANLQASRLKDANLQEARLDSANLQEALLWGANLQGAILRGANLMGANLRGALLGPQAPGGIIPDQQQRAAVSYLAADLSGADLQAASDLTQPQLDSANGDDRTVLPEGLTRPAHWPKSEGNGGGDQPPLPPRMTRSRGGVSAGGGRPR